MPSRPIQRSRRVVDEVHERLLEMIVTGELAPESRLKQALLAEELGVSRTPIREALLQLEREGLVCSEPGRGMSVRGATPTEVLDMYEVRLLLEPYAARRACQQASSREIARVRDTQDRLEGLRPEADLAEALRLNAELHLQLVAPCGNRPILRFLSGFWAQDQALRMYALQMAGDEAAATRMDQDHHAIIAAFAARDGDLVERLVTEHVEGSVELLRRRQDALGRAARQQTAMTSHAAGAAGADGSRPEVDD